MNPAHQYNKDKQFLDKTLFSNLYAFVKFPSTVFSLL